MLFTQKICKNCRFWEDHNKYEGFCRLDAKSIPHMVKFWKIKPRESAGESVWAKHDEVRTSPKFGCNQWEKNG